jgi:LTXXQ motif family protein
MTSVKWLSVVVLSVSLSGATFAAGRGGGGGGHGGGGGGFHGGGGGGFHGGGGGGFHGGGGGFHAGGGGFHGGGFGGGARFGGGHFGGARVGGFHGGGGHFSGARGGAARFAGGARHFGGRAAGGVHTQAAFSRAAGGSSFRNNGHAALGHNMGGQLNRQGFARANAIHHALAAGAVAGALHNHGALNNANSRANITAAAATAGWRGHDRHGGWWRHANGGYGWVGPLFWPFAYYDLYDYTLWGYDPSLWDYGYGDIYAGIFAPYGYDDLAGYLPYAYGGGAYGSGSTGSIGSSSRGAVASNETNQLAQMCGEDTQEIAGLPIDRIQQALNLGDEQRKALDDLGNASVKAAQLIKDACPTDVASTAPARLAAMQARLEAMISGVRVIEPPLDHFYGLLNDEQKQRLTALGEEQRRGRNSQGVMAQGCGNGQSGVTDWPTAEIERRLHPTEAQRASLTNLKDAAAQAADMLKGTCEPNEALTPPARLAAADKRLNAMLQAVETVKSAVDDFYAELSDEQKAQFESIGPARDVQASASTPDETAPASHRRYHHRYHASAIGIIRRLIGF